jgi:hypothetical protein
MRRLAWASHPHAHARPLVMLHKAHALRGAVV